MSPVYFDTSVFLAILAGEPKAAQVKALLRELKADKIRIYTSILTVQEVSVASFKHGTLFTDNHTKLAKLARIAGVTKEVALTAAKFEADIILASKKTVSKADQATIDDNRRRKFDCFHLATAVALNCAVLYAFDDQYSSKCKVCGVSLSVGVPEPRTPSLLDQIGPQLGSKASIL
jgi:predicted nucleic acid-binding protein